MLERRYVSQCVSSDYCKGWNDAVDSIIRCKACQYYKEDEKRCDHPSQDCYDCYDCWLEMEPDDFCSYGERREGNA